VLLHRFAVLSSSAVVSSIDSLGVMFTGIEHLVVILTTVGGGIGSAIIAWYRIRKDVKRAEAEAAAAEAEAEKETPAPPMGGDASPILVARVDALDLRVIQLQADVATLQAAVKVLVAKLGKIEIAADVPRSIAGD
jgi:hypothetical protein